MGVTCGITAVPIYTIGAFVGPLEDTYGWSRGAILSATSVAYLALIFSGPIAGFLTDRHGPRQVALWSVAGNVPEPLRLAHLIAGGVVSGESRGRA